MVTFFLLLPLYSGKRTLAATGTTSEAAPGGGVEVTLDPSELELEPEAVAARYERHLREHRPKGREDLSDMLADHVARQKVGFKCFYILASIKIY